jgi:uncharacterized protein (DUF2141 family)
MIAATPVSLRRLAFALALAMTLPLCTLLLGQARDTRPAGTPSGTIAGTAVSDEPEPRKVRRVRVTCTGPDFSATVVSDDNGRFTFTGLKPGRYTVSGTKDAWVPSAYGARRPTRPGSAIPVAAGQTVPITLRMLRGSVVTGVVLDYNNQPAADTPVTAMRYTMQNGTRRLAPVGSSITDDRGVYRIYGLAPGDYFVGAAPRAVAALNAPSSELRLLDDRLRRDRSVAFAPSYFPGTPVATQAATVTLRAGEERDGIDFALQLVPTARVQGTVTTVEGVPAPSGTQVNLISNAASMFQGGSFGALRSARVGADGAFSFADIPPGPYTVLSRASAPGPAVAPRVTQITWASTDLVVDGEDISGIVLGLQPGMTITGRLTFDATRLKPPANPRSIEVGLQPLQSQGSITFSSSGAVIDDSGRFVIAGIIPGTYRLTASLPGIGRPDNFYLRSATLRGQDTADRPIAIRAGESIHDASIRLSDRPAQLTGTIHNASGPPNEYTVVLFPADQSLWLPLSRRIRGTRPAADGVYTFRGLPPGEYLVAAIDDVEPNEWFDPALLQRLLPTAFRIALAEGEDKVQDIRLGTGG